MSKNYYPVENSKLNSSLKGISYYDRQDREVIPDLDDVSTCSSSTNSTTNRAKNVSFSNLEVKFFSYDLGDSYGVKDGPPLTISWDCFKEIAIPIEKYELAREPRGPVRIIKPNERMNILLRKGVDISRIEDTIESIRRRRIEEEEEAERLLESNITKSRKIINFVPKINVKNFTYKKWRKSRAVFQY